MLAVKNRRMMHSQLHNRTWKADGGVITLYATPKTNSKNGSEVEYPKSVLIFFLLVFIGVALALIPGFNHGVAGGMTAINQVTASTAPGTASSVIFDNFKYERSIDVLAMLLVGFGFLMVFVRKHGYSSITATYIAVSVAIPLYLMIKSFGSGTAFLSTVNIDSFLLAEFAAASLLIAIGAPLGRLRIEQYLLLSILFVPAYILNEWLILHTGFFQGFMDTGGSVVIHAFGAYFGLGVVATTMKYFEKDQGADNDTASNQFCLIGSMVLWLFWPSFTSALVSPNLVVLTAINTVFALCGATIATILFSKLLRGKVEIADIANAALAGGVAIGATCASVSPGFGMLIGIAAGALSTIGYAVIAPKVERLIKGTDTCGVHNLHGMPGILGGLAAIFVTGHVGVQLMGIVVTVIIAFCSGRVAGLCVGLFSKKEIPYSDSDEFFMGSWAETERRKLAEKSELAEGLKVANRSELAEGLKLTEVVKPSV